MDIKIPKKENKEFWKTKVVEFHDLPNIWNVKEEYEKLQQNLDQQKDTFIFAMNTFFNSKTQSYDCLVWIKYK